MNDRSNYRTSEQCTTDSTAHGVTRLSQSQRLLITVTFFSMFFGASNLIFPPVVGARSASEILPATIGFIISAVGLPVLGVLAVSTAGGFDQLASRVCRWFSTALGVIIILTIGPLFALPRTAATSFSMAVAPFNSPLPNWLETLLYSVVLFTVSFMFSQHPERLSKTLGRVTGPVLMAIIASLFVYCLFVNYQPPMINPKSPYAGNPMMQGVLEGYQTMDLIAGVYFGIVIAINIRQYGVTKASDNGRELGFAGLGAGVILALVYGALSFIGRVSTALNPVDLKANGATVLTNLVSNAFGDSFLGPLFTLLIGLVFIIACVNVSISLISTCASYFEEKFPTVWGKKVDYRTWSVLFTLVSFAISNVGLDAIIMICVPVLQALYPICIVLVLLALVHRVFSSRFEKVYVWSVLFVGILSAFTLVVELVELFGGSAGLARTWLDSLPLSQQSLTWIILAVVGVVVGVVDSLVRGSKNTAGNLLER